MLERTPGDEAGRWRRRLSGLRIETRPLRTSRDFRLLLGAGTVFYLGAMVSYVAVPYQLYELTGSNLAVGLLGVAELVPLLVFGLWGGALADHVDRRRLLVVTGVAQAVLTATLMVNALLPEPQVAVIYTVGALLSVAQSLQRPSREALIPRTVVHDELPAAVSLTSLGAHLGMLAGPTLGGVLVSSAGAWWAYAVTTCALVVATVMFGAMGPYAHTRETRRPSMRSIGEGLRYAVGRRDLLGTYVVDLVAMFMAMPVVLFPALAQHVFADPQVLGLLYTAETVGALLATATSGWSSRVQHHGRAVVVAAAAYGAFVALAGLAPTVWWALAALTLAGAADMISGLFRSIVGHQTIPDD
jgi:MFS family permease